MHTTPLFRNRIRHYLSPVTAFGQMPPDVERVLWFLAGFLTAWLLPLLVRK
jgi:hypothetical protein